MHWVVQNNMFSEEGFTRLLSALERLGVPHSLVKVVPFSHDLVWVDAAPLDKNIVIMGTYTLAEIARNLGWTPGSFHNENFDYKVQSIHWREAMLNYEARYSRFADVSPYWDRPFFIRPVHDTKSFIGQVMDWPSFKLWREGVLALTPEDQPTIVADTPVMVAPKREIFTETRVWMVDGRAVTASLYKFGTIKRYEERGPRTEECLFAEDLARRWQPARAYVVDVADTQDGHKVVEVNNFNCAGFYAGDMQRLVAAVENMTW